MCAGLVVFFIIITHIVSVFPILYKSAVFDDTLPLAEHCH